MRATTRAAVLALPILAAASGAALAQSADPPQKPSQSQQQVETGDKLPEYHLFGDWDGLQPLLLDRGLDVTLDYLSETAGVVSGGRRTGADYAQQVALQADLDWGKLAAIEGLSTHIAIVQRAGRSASADYLDEQSTHVQQIYGSGGDVLAHLSYLYAEQSRWGGAVDLEAGRLDVGQDFDTSPLYCEFMTLSICPSPRSLSLESGFTIFPAATWGGRIRVRPVSIAYLQAGLYQVRSQYGGRSGWDWSTGDTSGGYFPVEAGLVPQFGPDRLVGHYKFGFTWNTSRLPDLAVAQSGAPITQAGQTGRGDQGQASYYVALDQMILRTGKTGTDGVILLAGYTHEDRHTSVLDQQAYGGIFASGVIPGRPDDNIGFEATWLETSPNLSATQEREAAMGQTLSTGLNSLTLPPAGVQSHETVYEARYDFVPRSGLHFMPDLQYVVRPNATARTANATVLGLQVTVDF